jgi:hypothetical protein
MSGARAAASAEQQRQPLALFAPRHFLDTLRALTLVLHCTSIVRREQHADGLLPAACIAQLVVAAPCSRA